MHRSLSVFACLLLALLFGLNSPLKAEGLSSNDLAHLAVLEGGGHKPLDSFAWESIRSIYGKSHYKDSEGKRWESIDLIIDLAAKPDYWKNQPLVRIDYHELKERLGFHIGEKYFSFEEITSSPALSGLIEEARRLNADTANSTKLSTETQALYGRLVVLDELLSSSGFRLFPDPADEKAHWLSPDEVGGDVGHAWHQLLSAWSAGDGYTFSEALSTLRQEIRQRAGSSYPTPGAIDQEVMYNRMQPFHKAWMIYMVLALLSLIAAAWPHRLLKTINTLLLLAALGYHSAGLLFITMITGRAPISNLFESMVFIIWAMILLAAIYYFLSKRENYLAIIAGVLGTITMGYALDSTIDISINPLVPVLKSYWLNIHVTIITFSYGAFAVAAGLGHVYLWKYRMNPSDVSGMSKVDNISYKLLGIGILTLTAGIILGGVWANESWGRYWGWDPKETWSLITLLFYMVIIHGRMNGWINKLRTAILNITGLVVVLMTYFGVNYYLSGLHSYATGNPEPMPLKLFVYLAAEIAFVLFCLYGGKARKAAGASA
jgi:cytochrome c-type biogenesis protein CcsB